jgi:hypothetical protein
VKSPVDKSNILIDELWEKTMGASDWSDWINQLHIRFGCKATWGHTTCAENN